VLVWSSLLVIARSRKRENGLMEKVISHIHECLSLFHIIDDILVLIRVNTAVIVYLFNNFRVRLLFGI
jgi:hypothetical protein